LKGQLKEIERKRQMKGDETLERNPQPLFFSHPYFSGGKQYGRRANTTFQEYTWRLCHVSRSKAFF